MNLSLPMSTAGPNATVLPPERAAWLPEPILHPQPGQAAGQDLCATPACQTGLWEVRKHSWFSWAEQAKSQQKSNESVRDIVTGGDSLLMHYASKKVLKLRP